MEQWQLRLQESVCDVDRLAGRFGIDTEELRRVAEVYPFRVTEYYLGLVREVGDPIWCQCIPDPRELEDDNQLPDPLHETRLSPVPNLIHRYPDRVVWLVSGSCAVYCRFCMRKRHVGCGGEGECGEEDALRYIAGNRAIRDVILSGGDPLLLDDDRLEGILSNLRAIPHVEIIRIGTRLPVTLPDRITDNLCRMLKKYQPIYLNTHFNHPTEVTELSTQACAMLADAGVQLGNQTVLLRGVNDDPETMKRLMQRLLAIRVRPYYIHQLDLVRGTGHFRTPVARGLEIMDALRGHTSGLAVPYFMIDLPGGKGKVPLLPGAVEKRGTTLLLRNYQGEPVEYEDVLDNPETAR